MFNSQSLEVAVGLVLVFLLFSLVLTAFREALEGILKSRAQSLEKAIAELLDDRSGEDMRLAFYKHPLIASLFPGEATLTRFTKDGKAEGSVGDRAIKALKERTRLPSYIPRDLFASAVDDLLKGGKASEKFKNAYDALMRSAGGDPAATRQALEQWYDGAMDRAAGWYKRRSQLIIGLAGLVLAVILNINAVTIARHLSTNEAARAQAVKLAEGTAPPAPGVTTGEQLADFRTKVEPLDLPIGWNRPLIVKFGELGTGAKAGEIALLIAGYLIVGLAGMLGAPFWFDALGKIIVIRSTVKPREKSQDEASKDGGTGGRPDKAPPRAPPPGPAPDQQGGEGEQGLVVYG